MYVFVVRSLSHFVLHPTHTRVEDLEERNGVRCRDEMSAVAMR